MRALSVGIVRAKLRFVQQRLSKEIPRGETVTIEFTPDVAGAFPILCTEYCGEGHEEMKGQLIVKAREAVQP